MRSRVFWVLPLLFCGASKAVEPHFYLGAGLDVGGDEVLKIKYVGGGSDSLRAGEGVHLALGTDVDFAGTYMARATIGYKEGGITAKNGDATFSRVPVELTGYRFWGEHGLGAGLTHQSNIRVRCDFSGGICPFSKVDVKDATGVLIEYLYRVRHADTNRGYSIGVRIGGIDYQAEGGGREISGGFFGVNVGATL